MSSYEVDGVSPPTLEFGSLDGLYESFRGGVLDTFCASMAQEPSLLDRILQIDSLASVAPERALAFLNQVRLDLTANGISDDNLSDAHQTAYTYAGLGHFDEALAIADMIDKVDPPDPNHTDEKVSLFRNNVKKIPDDYLERAVLTIAGLGNNSYVLDELFSIAEHHESVRQLVLGIAGQMITEQILPETEAPAGADLALSIAAYYAAKWGDHETSRAHYEKMSHPANRLQTELEIYGETKMLLAHQRLEDTYEEIVGGDGPFKGGAKVHLLLKLQKLGHEVDGEIVWDELQMMDDDIWKMRLLGDFVKTFQHPDARTYFVEHVTEQYVEDDQYGLLRLAKELPGLMIECESVLLSVLIKDGSRSPDKVHLAKALLDDYIATERLDEAIELAESFESQRYFGGYRKMHFKQRVIERVAGKGRDHFDQALALVATFSEGSDSFTNANLLASLVTAAHDYLTPDERETYLEACDGAFMTFQGWFKLAKATNRLDYLVRAKGYLDNERQTMNVFNYRGYLMEILKAYQEIETEGGANSE